MFVRLSTGGLVGICTWMPMNNHTGPWSIARESDTTTASVVVPIHRRFDMTASLFMMVHRSAMMRAYRPRTCTILLVFPSLSLSFSLDRRMRDCVDDPFEFPQSKRALAVQRRRKFNQWSPCSGAIKIAISQCLANGWYQCGLIVWAQRRSFRVYRLRESDTSVNYYLIGFRVPQGVSTSVSSSLHRRERERQREAIRHLLSADRNETSECKRQKTLLRSNETVEKVEGSQIFDTPLTFERNRFPHRFILFFLASFLRSGFVARLNTVSVISFVGASDKEQLVLCIALREPRYVTELFFYLLYSLPRMFVPSFLLSCRKVAELR